MNGIVSKVSKHKPDAVQPGCEIIVPSKKESKGFEALSRVMSVATSAASVATMAAAMTSLTK
jgi:hypothetical protein